MGVELDEVRLALAATRLDAIGRHHHWWPQESPPWSELDPIGREEFLDIVGLVIEAYGSDAAAEARGIAVGQWQPIETCPVWDGKTYVIAVGGRRVQPERTQANGDWWRRMQSYDRMGGPTHWLPDPLANLPAFPMQQTLPHDPIKGDEGRGG